MKLTNRFVIVALGLWFSLGLLVVPPSIFAQTGTWATKAPIPPARALSTAVTVNNIVYEMGGASASGYLNTVRAYDPVTDTWSTKAPMPTAREGSAAVAVNGIVYAIGGAAGGSPFATVEAYDPATNTWSTKAPMPTARRILAAVAVNGIVYAIGGAAGSVTATVEAYDPVTNTWGTKAPMPTPRMDVAAAVVNGILYAIGGSASGPTIFATVEAYDPVTNTWSTKAPMPTARQGLATVVVNGIVYAIGGSSLAGVLPSVEGYNPVTNTWSIKAPMPTARYDMAAAAANGIIYTIAGYNSAYTGTSTFEAYTPAIAPTADAGPDQTVNEGATVTLNGSGSHDPNNDPLTYQWTQVSGPPVTLNVTNPVHPTFMAPTVPVGGATLTFELRVNDGQAESQPDVVNVSVVHLNHSPVSNAGPDQTVHEGAMVALDGLASYDPDGETLSYLWVQTSGPTVPLSNAGVSQPTFTAPFITTATVALTFALTVADGSLNATDSVTVTVENVNHPPVANAGPDQTKNENTVVTLNGAASSDPDGDPVSYTWSQLNGPPVVLAGASSPTPTFTAPEVGAGGATLQFQLMVNDGLAASAPDTVQVTVTDMHDPPVCTAAKAKPKILWPPNHKLKKVKIRGLSHTTSRPDDDDEHEAEESGEEDHLTITVTAVTQDEPVNGLGDGDMSPDAVIQNNQVLLRAERAGKGNGRVYVVYFTADDEQGGACSGAVRVEVPQSKGSGTAVIDSGQGFNSLLP